MALHEGTQFEKGEVRDTDLDTYKSLRMLDVPELDISFIESTQGPVGLGEPATTVVAPAIANAIFNATRARLRHIPMMPAKFARLWLKEHRSGRMAICSGALSAMFDPSAGRRDAVSYCLLYGHEFQ